MILQVHTVHTFCQGYSILPRSQKGIYLPPAAKEAEWNSFAKYVYMFCCSGSVASQRILGMTMQLNFYHSIFIPSQFQLR